MTNRRPISSRIAQVLLIAGSWVLFVAFWVQVLLDTAAHTMVQGGVLLTVALMVTVAVTGLWIAHNIRIFRVKGPRRAIPAARQDVRPDFMGRIVIADCEAVTRARMVRVTTTWTSKVYAPAMAREGLAASLVSASR